MRLTAWLSERGGVGHRDDASDAGYAPSHVRAAIRAGAVRRIRAKWIALPSAPAELVTAAFSGGTVTCTTLARRRGWWVPPDADATVHLHLPSHESLRAENVHAHWTAPLGPRRPRVLEASVEDALSDAAQCHPLDQAVAIWESAIRVEATTLEALRSVRWRSAAARRCLEHVRPGAGSSLETVFHVRLSAGTRCCGSRTRRSSTAGTTSSAPSLPLSVEACTSLRPRRIGHVSRTTPLP